MDVQCTWDGLNWLSPGGRRYRYRGTLGGQIRGHIDKEVGIEYRDIEVGIEYRDIEVGIEYRAPHSANKTAKCKPLHLLVITRFTS